MIEINNNYDEIISLDNLFFSWDEFKRGKMKKLDVLMFERHLEDNIFALHDDLKSFNYCHGPYATFHIFDPKHRIISKALVRDRLVHHLVFKELDNIFDGGFIYHSYASRNDKGTHLAVNNLFCCLRKVSKNYNHNVYALKGDVKKFFPSISHQKLLALIKRKIKDSHFLWLIEEIINSFPKEQNSKRES